MRTTSFVLVSLFFMMIFFFGCTSAEKNKNSLNRESLVGAWEVDSLREKGNGKNLLTFSSDGTFFRSGDTHPTFSGGHGSWIQTSETEYQVSYVALRFEKDGTWTGIARNRIKVNLASDGMTFSGIAKTSTRDLDDKEIKSSETKLNGKRIRVETF